MNKKSPFFLLLASSILVSLGNATASTIVIDPTITVQGMATASTAAGPTTSPDDLKRETEHAAHYNGPTEFIANYTIAFTADCMVDSQKSAITFTTVNYTDLGAKVPSHLAYLPTPITSVTCKDDGSIGMFQFSSMNWYPPTGPGATMITNNGISGSIDLMAGTGEFTSSYIVKSNGAIDTYKVVGPIATPGPPVPPPILPHDEIFTPFDELDEAFPDADDLPEPPSMLSLLTGFGGLALLRYRRH